MDQKVGNVYALRSGWHTAILVHKNATNCVNLHRIMRKFGIVP